MSDKPNQPREDDAVLGGQVSLRFEFQTVTVNRRGEIIRTETKQARYFRQDLSNDVTLDLVFIPGGKFLMGAPEDDEKHRRWDCPQHWVTVPPFYMGKYPITEAQWQAVTGLKNSEFRSANQPVEEVSWSTCVEFCEKLSKITELEFRLPSEAEWEYACRAGTTTPFHFGESITTDLASYDGRHTYGCEPRGVHREQATEVGSFPPNAFGLYDMHGNVWEWCQDVFNQRYEGAPTDGSAWLSKESVDQFDRFDAGHPRVKRGGSWDYPPCPCWFRHFDYPDWDGDDADPEDWIGVGLRVVCAFSRTL